METTDFIEFIFYWECTVTVEVPHDEKASGPPHLSQLEFGIQITTTRVIHTFPQQFRKNVFV